MSQLSAKSMALQSEVPVVWWTVELAAKLAVPPPFLCYLDCPQKAWQSRGGGQPQECRQAALALDAQGEPDAQDDLGRVRTGGDPHPPLAVDSYHQASKVGGRYM